jgi:CBS domain containing-hemolysin-like protein
MLCLVPVWPFLYAFQLTDSFVRRLLGAPPATPKELQQEREEQFLTSLELQKMQGIVDEQEKEMIENVLQLSNTTVSEIMTPRMDMVAIEVTSDLKAILDAITSTGHSRVPVYEGSYDNVVGFIYAKDLLTAIDKNPSSFNLRERLREVYFVPKTKLLRDLLHEFQNQKLHIAIVIDEYGGTAGLVSIEDILEELVGEITDEYEKISPKPIKQVDANTLETDAKTPINSINDQFELNLPASEDYDTISGFILSHLGYVPKTGESFDYKNLKFTVLSAEARRIKRIKIQKTPV